MTERKRAAVCWLGSYLLLVLAPLLVLLLVPVPARGGFWYETAIACGFLALAMLVMQFFLTARLRRVSAPFGIDVLYSFHRYFAWGLCLVVLLHPLLLQPQGGLAWHRLGHDLVLQSGLLSLLLLVSVMLMSVWRRRLHLAYHHWRRLHLLLSVGVLALAFLHVKEVSYYGALPILSALLWTMLLASLALIVHVHLLRPARLLRRPWRVREVRAEQGDCWTLSLDPEGHDGLQFRPGQFAWLSLGHSPFSLQEHPFSLASPPRADGSVEFTIKAVGDFTRTLGETPLGARAWVDGPFGVFSCDHYPDASGYVFIGGGIGIAPLFSMLQALAARGDQRPHALFAAHSRFDRIPRREELVALTRQLRLLTVPVLEEPPELWRGETGWLTLPMLERYLVEPDYLQHEFFLCGPKPMTDLAEACLRILGVPAAHIHTELFSMA
ncbi:MAG TPA: oxidoreductase [Pseudomonadaceae bacterium]|nr:oxidoreductase [Pseudomonadaceae bacterium]